mmetsp:Transcript_9478/g.15957  ORF Transcript_9478/g.15957 Transcript_9478/m.15957 type:complete len:86 (+) Transcript_9478:898-1155(+)
MLKNPSTTELAQVMVSIGLAQNLAALRALSVEGIQRGHMKLHAKNVAIRSGVPTELVEEAVKFMEESRLISEEGAEKFMAQKKRA